MPLDTTSESGAMPTIEATILPYFQVDIYQAHQQSVCPNMVRLSLPWNEKVVPKAFHLRLLQKKNNEIYYQDLKNKLSKSRFGTIKFSKKKVIVSIPLT